MEYVLRLYVTGHSPNSVRAISNLKKLLEAELNGLYTLKIVDVLKNPQLAEEDKILATPTLIRVLPPPVTRIIGDLSDRDKVLSVLGLPMSTGEREEKGIRLGPAGSLSGQERERLNKIAAGQAS